MIPAIILMLMRRYQKNNPRQFLILKMKLFYVVRIFFLIVVAFLLVLISKAQEKNFAYTIKRNGNKIGNLTVKEIKEGNKINLRLQSDIKVSFIFNFSAKGIEEANYDNGMLMYSSVYQKFNGNERVNKQIRFVNDAYVINNNGKEERFDNVRIYYNLLCIYSHEPLSTVFIFSDRFQKFLPIQKLEEHHYRIKFPDGSANEYWFENGVCKKIDVDHAFYSVVMELNR
jgi:hypothetical protein